jgi:hypothetical protein
LENLSGIFPNLGKFNPMHLAKIILNTRDEPAGAGYPFNIPVKPIEYEQTDYFRVYRDFLTNRNEFLK